MATHRCEFLWSGDRQGILYWLGSCKGRHAYENPHSIGAVRVNASTDGVAQVRSSTGSVVDIGDIGAPISVVESGGYIPSHEHCSLLTTYHLRLATYDVSSLTASLMASLRFSPAPAMWLTWLSTSVVKTALSSSATRREQPSSSMTHR